MLGGCAADPQFMYMVQMVENIPLKQLDDFYPCGKGGARFLEVAMFA